MNMLDRIEPALQDDGTLANSRLHVHTLAAQWKKAEFLNTPIDEIDKVQFFTTYAMDQSAQDQYNIVEASVLDALQPAYTSHFAHMILSSFEVDDTSRSGTETLLGL